MNKIHTLQASLVVAALCGALAGDAKGTCIDAAKARFGRT
jgi:hypothetical protein